MAGKARDGAAIGATGATDAVVVAETATGAAGTVGDEVRATDGARVVVEGTSAAAAAGAEAAAAGGSGAGVGGHRNVEAVEGLTTRDVPLEGVDGDRRGTLGRSGSDRRAEFGGYLDDVAAGRRTGAYDAVAVATAATRPGRNAILPLAEPKLDPSLVPGVKIATAASQVRRGHRSFAPGEKFPVDFKAHAQLTDAGVIVAELWHEMPDHDLD